MRSEMLTIELHELISEGYIQEVAIPENVVNLV